MNKSLYRIVFSQSRGQYVAVQETAASASKSPGSTRAGRGVTPGVLRVVSVAVRCALGVLTLSALPANAQIIGDPSAPGGQRPSVLVAPNGVPLVNIQTPSAAGVSRNTYSQFDVQRNGVILNNSRSDVQTQLGGWTQGNPWLGSGSARVIVNEVNSANPSLLKGYLEVAGQKADVIIANPAGIKADGGGFINAGNVVLTTGTPQWNASGSLDSYRVQRGTFVVEGLGLDTRSASSTQIMARAAQINAGLWANYLAVTLGVNDVSATDPASVTPQTGTGVRPAFSLDVAAIGGMYAGHIRLVGTEAGLGFNNTGAFAASQGALVLSADGKLINTGLMRAAGNAEITTAGGLANSGSIYAGGSVTLTSRGEVSLNGQTAAGGDVAISGTQLDLTGGQISAQNLRLAASSGGIDASRATLTAQGSFEANAAQTLKNTGGLIAANADLTLVAGRVDNTGGTIASVQGGVRITTSGATVNDAGKLQAALDVTLANAGLSNSVATVTTEAGSATQSGNISGRNITITTGGQTLDNRQGAISSSGTLSLTTARLDNAGGYINATGALTASTAEVANTQGGQIASASDITFSTSGFDNRGGQVQAVGDLSIGAGVGAINNAASLIRANGKVTLSAATVVNSNTAGSNQGMEGSDISIAADRIANDSGAIRAGSKASLINSGLIDNSSGLISAGKTLTVRDDAVLRALAINNTGGTLVAGEAATIAADSLVGQGKVLSRGTLDIDLKSDFNNTGEVIANRDLKVSSTGNVSNSGKLQSGAALSLNANSIDNTASGDITASNTSISAAQTLTNRGLIDGKDTRINAAVVNNVGTGRIYGDYLSIALSWLEDYRLVAGADVA